MSIHTWIPLAVLLGASASWTVEDKPDFTGEWILNRPASTLSPGADAVQSGVVRIKHHDPTFRYTAEFVTGSNPLKYDFELLSDGHELVSTAQGGRTVSSLRWDGDALALTFRMQRDERAMTVSFRYELLDGGRRLRAVEEVRGSDHDQDNEWIFDRR